MSEQRSSFEKKREHQRIRNKIVGMYKDIVAEVDPKNVLDLLIQKRIINIEFKEELMAKVTRQDRCRALLDHLLICSNDESFIVLREALEEHYHWIVERIDASDETKDEPGKKSTTDFRCRLEEHCAKMQNYSEEMLSKKMDMERQKREFLKKTLETENAIKSKSQLLKSLIDQHTQAVLDELFMLKQKHQKKMETEIEEIERKLTAVRSFVTNCIELKSKGTPSEVCDSADSFNTKAKELSKETEEYLNAPSKSIEIEFTATKQTAFLQNVSNIVGKLSELEKEFERFAIVIGISDSNSISKDVIKINLNRSEDVSYLEQIPTQMRIEAAAAVYCNSIFVTGIGDNWDEIWKFDSTSSNWKKCASLVKGRLRHSVAFVDHVLYICGGWVDSNKSTLDDVEAYDAIDDKCTTVGKLVYAVRNAGNCVPFKALLYICGGGDANYKGINDVQVYNTKSNTCSLLSKPMPRAKGLLRAALWENSVILLGMDSCFIYNFDTESWEVRDQFKTDVIHFGMTVNNGKIFVIGGGKDTTDADGKVKWICRDDINYIPVMNILNDTPTEWRHYAKLSKPSLVHALAKMDFGK